MKVFIKNISLAFIAFMPVYFAISNTSQLEKNKPSELDMKQESIEDKNTEVKERAPIITELKPIHNNNNLRQSLRSSVQIEANKTRSHLIVKKTAKIPSKASLDVPPVVIEDGIVLIPNEFENVHSAGWGQEDSRYQKWVNSIPDSAFEDWE